MATITALRKGKGRNKRINIYLDGSFAFSLEAESVSKGGLQTGSELSADDIEALSKLDHTQRCLGAALRYLNYRPRSEHEVAERLKQHDFDDSSIAATTTRLKERGLIDDIAFARFWKENREAFSPRSRSLTRMELKRKGVNGDVIEQVINDADDQENAYKAGLGRVRHLPLSDYQVFHRKLGAYLSRRGFNYEMIRHAVERIWQEQSKDFEEIR